MAAEEGRESRLWAGETCNRRKPGRAQVMLGKQPEGTRLGDGRVGAACSWQTAEGWAGRCFFLGNNKEVFDAKLYVIYQAVRVLEASGRSGRRCTIFSDSQAAIRQALTDSLSPGQQWAKTIIESERVMANNNHIWIC